MACWRTGWHPCSTLKWRDGDGKKTRWKVPRGGSHNQMIKEPPPHTHTVGVLPITTQGSRYPFSTSPHMHTHDPRLCGSESGGVIPIEEPPPRGDSGLGLGTGQYTQLPCGCPAEPYQSWGRWFTPAGWVSQHSGHSGNSSCF